MKSPLPQYSREKVRKHDCEETSNTRLLFATKRGRDADLKHKCDLFEILNVCEDTGIEANKAFMNTFANGVNVYSIYSPGNVSDEAWSKLV